MEALMMTVINQEKNPNPTPKQNQQGISHSLKILRGRCCFVQGKLPELASLMKFHTVPPS